MTAPQLPHASTTREAAVWASNHLATTLNRHPMPRLDTRFRDTLRLMASGYSAPLIAEQLGVAMTTIKSRQLRIASLLGVQGQAKSVLAGLAWGIVRRSDVVPVGYSPPGPPLTPTMRAVVQLTACGLTRTQIAARLGINVNAVVALAATIKKRLGTRNGTHAAAVIALLGLLEVPGIEWGTASRAAVNVSAPDRSGRPRTGARRIAAQ